MYIEQELSRRKTEQLVKELERRKRLIEWRTVFRGEEAIYD